MKIHRSSNLVAVLALSFLGVACSDSASLGPNAETAAVSLSFFVPQAPAAAVSFDGPQGVITQNIDGDELVIDRVQMVVREIELKRQFEICEDDSSGDNDDCEEFEVGPFLADLPLDGSTAMSFSIVVPDGIYDELEFEIHKPDDDSAEDLEFLLEHSDFKGVSIRVDGTFNGEAFVFLQDMNEDQEMNLSPALEVPGMDGPGPINVTLSIDVKTWFVNADGSLIDPESANKGNDFESVVEDNIENSIDVFEDDDRDGDDDSDDDDSDDDDDNGGS